MHVRPFFWLLLLISCTSVIAFSVLYQPHAPTFLQVHVVQQQLVANSPTSLELHLAPFTPFHKIFAPTTKEGKSHFIASCSRGMLSSAQQQHL